MSFPTELKYTQFGRYKSRLTHYPIMPQNGVNMGQRGSNFKCIPRSSCNISNYSSSYTETKNIQNVNCSPCNKFSWWKKNISISKPIWWNDQCSNYTILTFIQFRGTPVLYFSSKALAQKRVFCKMAANILSTLVLQTYRQVRTWRLIKTEPSTCENVILPP